MYLQKTKWCRHRVQVVKNSDSVQLVDCEGMVASPTGNSVTVRKGSLDFVVQPIDRPLQKGMCTLPTCEYSPSSESKLGLGAVIGLIIAAIVIILAAIIVTILLVKMFRRENKDPPGTPGNSQSLHTGHSHVHQPMYSGDNMHAGYPSPPYPAAGYANHPLQAVYPPAPVQFDPNAKGGTPWGEPNSEQYSYQSGTGSAGGGSQQPYVKGLSGSNVGGSQQGGLSQPPYYQLD